MKKVLFSFAIFVMALCANAQKNQYFWYQGNLMLGTEIAQIDSVTFGDDESTDTLYLLLPRTIIKTVRETITMTIHDTLYLNKYVCLPEGALPGEFSVSPTKKVRFSKGNLQYQASTNTWRFAENQWDYIGEPNINISPNYDGWIDLFGWGTGSNPTKWEQDDSDYAQFTDWGKNIASGWYTLSMEEWQYLLQGRSNAENLYSVATIENTKGLIFFPDNYSKIVPISYNWEGSPISKSEWSTMQNEGAVFLPAAGVRSTSEHSIRGYSNANESNIWGDYWSSSASSSLNAYYFVFATNHATGIESRSKNDGRAVRLVYDVE